MYATQPERFLQLQCEGECWCNLPDARAHSWAGHGRGPTACPFETRPFDEGFARGLVAARQAQALGQVLPINEPRLMLEVVAAFAHLGDRGNVSLAQCLRTRFSNDLPVLLTAHVPPSALADDVDPAVRSVFRDSAWSVVAVSEGPSLRTG